MQAAALENRGEARQAAGHLARSAAEVQRLRASLAPEQRGAFESLPEVQEALRHAGGRTMRVG